MNSLKLIAKTTLWLYKLNSECHGLALSDIDLDV